MRQHCVATDNGLLLCFGCWLSHSKPSRYFHISCMMWDISSSFVKTWYYCLRAVLLFRREAALAVTLCWIASSIPDIIVQEDYNEENLVWDFRLVKTNYVIVIGFGSDLSIIPFPVLFCLFRNAFICSQTASKVLLKKFLIIYWFSCMKPYGELRLLLLILSLPYLITVSVPKHRNTSFVFCFFTHH